MMGKPTGVSFVRRWRPDSDTAGWHRLPWRGANGTGHCLAELDAFAVGFLGLVATWWLLFVWVAGMTEGWLVPWDTTPDRPPIGAWQRTINDFFEVWPGSLVPGWVILALSVGIFVTRIVRGGDWRWLPWAFAVTNLIFIAVDLTLASLAWQPPVLNVLRAPSGAAHTGYQYTWAPLGVTLLLFTALFLAQATIRTELQQAGSASGRSTLRLQFRLQWDGAGVKLVIWQ